MNPSDHDPLIHGPAPAAPSAGPALAAPTYDPSRSNPFEDLLQLIRHPLKFFGALEQAPLTPWLWGKAVVGFLIAVWAGSLPHYGRSFESRFTDLWDHLDDRYFAFLQHQSGIDGLKAKILGAWTVMQNVFFAAAPLASIWGLIFWAASVMLVLPLFGVERRRISFTTLLIAGLFAKWILVLGFLPGIGLLAGLAAALWLILAVQGLYRVTFVEALVASHLLGWAMALAGMILVGAGLVLGLFFLLH